ncbi:golgi transport 1B [Balamuthia mandrillaris]
MNEDSTGSYFSISDNQKIGILLSGFGLFFTFFGVLLFFDRGLLAIGNLLFLAGVTLVIGPHKTFLFFFQRRKIVGTICFLGGIMLVILGYTFIGMLIEGFGFANLFGDFMPVVVSFARRMPILGTLLDLPGIRHVVDRIVESRRLPV